MACPLPASPPFTPLGHSLLVSPLTRLLSLLSVVQLVLLSLL
jgi:hypothetical protein